MDQSSPRIDVAFLPVYPNPYQHLLAAALEAENVIVHLLEELPRVSWLHENRDRIDWLHLHWLTGLYMARYRTPLTLLRFWQWLAEAQKLQYRLAWTAHNVYPHRPGLQPLHRSVRQRMLREADLVITHCIRGREELKATFHVDRPIHVIPHGSYVGTFPLEMDRESARARLSLDNDQFVYLSLGNIAGYKGLRAYAHQFLSTAAPRDVAVIAGRNRDASLVRELEQLAATDSRLRIHPGFVPDDELQLYFRAADVLVAPFRRILTSGSVLSAMGAGLPIIAPKLGCLEELVTPETGLTYDPTTPDGIVHALHEIKTCDFEVMGQAAAQRAASFRWDEIARQTAALYREPNDRTESRGLG